MKKLLSLILTIVMALSLIVGLTACGDGETVANGSGSNSETASGGSGDKGDNANNAGTSKTSTFSVNGISFTVPGEFEEGTSTENTMSIRGNKLSVSVTYEGEAYYATQEETVRQMAASAAKYDTSRTVEVAEKNGVFYYTLKDKDYDYAQAIYIVDGICISATASISDEAIDIITSFEFGK